MLKNKFSVVHVEVLVAHLVALLCIGICGGLTSHSLLTVVKSEAICTKGFDLVFHTKSLVTLTC